MLLAPGEDLAGGFWLVLQFLPPAASVQTQGFSSLWVLMPLPHSRGFQAIFLLVFLDLCWFPAKHSLTAQHQQAHSPSFPPRSPNQEHDDQTPWGQGCSHTLSPPLCCCQCRTKILHTGAASGQWELTFGLRDPKDFSGEL